MNNQHKETFPDYLDNAKVLYYTPKGNYGDLYYDDGTIAAHFNYMAICKYEKSDGYYLFMCNENFEVETDTLWNSIEQCMGVKSIGNNDKGDVLWIEKS